jgi:hypothetical protein
VWTFNLKTKEKPAKWIIAGVCLLLSIWRSWKTEQKSITSIWHCVV